MVNLKLSKKVIDMNADSNLLTSSNKQIHSMSSIYIN